MKRQIGVQIFESLSSGVRLDIYRLLVRIGPDGLVAGDIAAKLELPPTKPVVHSKALTQAGLVTVTQEGRYQRYRPTSRSWSIWSPTDGRMLFRNPEKCAPLRKSP